MPTIRIPHSCASCSQHPDATVAQRHRSDGGALLGYR
jgi:hypothetical protein